MKLLAFVANNHNITDKFNHTHVVMWTCRMLYVNVYYFLLHPPSDTWSSRLLKQSKTFHDTPVGQQLLKANIRRA